MSQKLEDNYSVVPKKKNLCLNSNHKKKNFNSTNAQVP